MDMWDFIARSCVKDNSSNNLVEEIISIISTFIAEKLGLIKAM